MLVLSGVVFNVGLSGVTEKVFAEQYPGGIYYPLDSWFVMSTTPYETAPATLYHGYIMEETPHEVTYQKSFSASVGSATAVCYKPIKSDYFEITGDYYLCFYFGGGVPGMSASIISGYFTRTLNATTNLSTISLVGALDSNNEYNKYINLVNSDAKFTNKTISDLLDSMFIDTTYKVKIIDKGSLPPIIKLSGSSELHRPELTFKLTGVGKWSGALSSEENNFYFTYDGETDAKIRGLYDHLAIKIGQDGKGAIIQKYDRNQLNDDSLRDGKARVEVDPINTWLDYIINRVYNAKNSDTSSGICGNVTMYDKTAIPPYTADNLSNKSYRQCINFKIGGWLDKWGVKVTEGSLTDPDGKGQCSNSNYKGVVRYIAEAFCGLAIALKEFADSFFAKALDLLESVIK